LIKAGEKACDVQWRALVHFQEGNLHVLIACFRNA